MFYWRWTLFPISRQVLGGIVKYFTKVINCRMLSDYICMHPILSDRYHLLLFSLYRFAFFALVSLLHLCCYRRAVLTNLLVVAGIQGVDPGLHRLQWSLNCTESCGAYTEQWQTDSSDLVRRTGLELVSVRGIPIVLHWISDTRLPSYHVTG